MKWMNGWIMTPTNLLGIDGRILDMIMMAAKRNANAGDTEAVGISATTVAGKTPRKKVCLVNPFFAENVQLPKLFARAQVSLIMTLISGTVEWEPIAIHVALLPAVIVEKQEIIIQPHVLNVLERTII
jgi:hypothetical protein